jgi:transposase
MHRHALTDEQWTRLQAVLPKRKSGPEALRGDREFVDAVLYRAKTGVPWRDLPERFGPWKTIYNRFDRWSKQGVWKQVFKALQLKVDKTGSIVDATTIRAHQDAAGGKGGSNETVWVIHVADSRPSSMSSRTRKGGRSTSRSPKGTGMK